MVTAPGRFLVVIPPEMEYLPGLFLPDPQSSKWLGSLQSIHDGCVYRDASVTAREAARAIRNAGVTSAEVLSWPEHGGGGAALQAAFAGQGIDIQPPDFARPLPVPERLRAIARTGFALIRRGTAVPAGTVAFEMESEDAWVRRAPGRVGAIPAWVTRIELARAGRAPRHDLLADPSCIFGIPVDAPDVTPETWAPLAGAVGPARLRLYRSSDEQPDPLDLASTSGARWASRYGLGSREDAARLLALVARFFPAFEPLVRTVARWCDLGIDPLEEMYAGNGIAERNAEMVANIVA